MSVALVADQEKVTSLVKASATVPISQLLLFNGAVKDGEPGEPTSVPTTAPCTISSSQSQSQLTKKANVNKSKLVYFNVLFISVFIIMSLVQLLSLQSIARN